MDRYGCADGNGGNAAHAKATTPSHPMPPLTSRQTLALPDYFHNSDAHVYTVTVRQSPLVGLSFGGNVATRRPLEPPLIVQLDIQDQHGNEIHLNDARRVLIATVSLLDAGSGAQADQVNRGDGTYVHVLEGRLVAQRDSANDLDGAVRSFFVFPDVSVRVDGRFRLLVSVVVLDPLISVLDPEKRAGTEVASGISDAFTVFDASTAPAVDGKVRTTDLTLHLRSQGISI